MAPTIRTCSLAIVAAALASQPATAKRQEPSALSAYVTARILDSVNATDAASAAYGRALTGAPDNDRVALRAYREAVEAGDKALALRAARALDLQQKLPQDARLLFFAEALSKGDWRGARLWLDKIEESDGFGFLVPTLRAWTTFAARDGDPLAGIDTVPRDGLSAIYLREHSVFLLLAQKQIDDGVAAAKALSRTDGRGLTLKIAGASQLVALKAQDRALELLAGDDPTLAAARAQVKAGKPLPGAVNNAGTGTAMLISRVAGDLIRDSASPASLSLARLASFVAPPNDAVKLTLAQTLAINGREAEALTVLDTVSPVLAPAVREIRFATLQRAGQHQEALTQAQAAVALPEASLFDYARLGDAYSRAKKHADAARAYEESIKRAGKDAPWNLWLLYGGALDAAGDWAKAKPALQRAVELGPDQPGALNHLGYAMLERNDNIDEATKLIAKASALRPDDAAITDSLGWALYLRGQHEQSIPLLERAVASEPTEAALGEHLGDAYWAAGRRVDARYAWRAALIQAEEDAISKRIQSKIADGLPQRTR